VRTVDLKPNGSQIPVTNENRAEFILRMSDYKLNQTTSAQTRAFFQGLSGIIELKWLRMFNQKELQQLIGGASIPIDLIDLQRNVVYGGGYDSSHPTIRMLWEVLQELDQDLQRKFLKFVTSCSRPPLLGFSELNPSFSIRRSGEEEDRLPTASTCVNLLKLPEYKSKELLKS